MEQAFDWSRFKRSIFIQSTPDKVFQTWIIPANISTWFLQEAKFFDSKGKQRGQQEEIQAGDSYEWRWWNYPHTESGKVLACDKEKQHLEFSFASDKCLVKIDVEVTEGDTLLRLEQLGMPIDDEHKKNLHLGCSNGWGFWMVNLKAWLEHGILLHDRATKHKTEDYEFCELINR
jgi:uncharacterized protein YndB with AHSA1/START domain